MRYLSFSTCCSAKSLLSMDAITVTCCVKLFLTHCPEMKGWRCLFFTFTTFSSSFLFPVSAGVSHQADHVTRVTWLISSSIWTPKMTCAVDQPRKASNNRRLCKKPNLTWISSWKRHPGEACLIWYRCNSGPCITSLHPSIWPSFIVKASLWPSEVVHAELLDTVQRVVSII